ncbi:MAG TPA: sigma-70 family RNA polymerase sigma factor [Phycisphaerae bacterium]|nr:sigma-70 family RNA polymerase sigma factor [Phycisphaerae bacterium]
MDTKQKYELNDYALELVHHKARQIVGKAGYTQEDIEDIEHDLIVDLLERLKNFNPVRAKYTTFVTRLVERKISKLLRHHLAEIRDYRQEACSLNEDIDVGEEKLEQRLVTISQDEHDLRSGRCRRPEFQREDMKLDIAYALAELSPELRQAGELLMTMPAAQVARKIGVSRSTFYKNHLMQLRAAFIEKGLDDYMPEQIFGQFSPAPGK